MSVGQVGGILVMPLNDTLQHVRRVGENQWVTRNMLNVSFATLRAPSRDESAQLLTLGELCINYYLYYFYW